MSILSPDFAVIGGVSITLGYSIFQMLLKILPHKLKSEQVQQRQLEISSAERRREQILKESRVHFEAKLKLTQETLESTLEEQAQSLQATDEELSAQTDFVALEEARLERTEAEVEVATRKLETIKAQHTQELSTQDSIRQTTVGELTRISGLDPIREKERLSEKQVSDRQLDNQKRLKDLSEDLGTNAKKLADRLLSRSLARYQPSFAWPKATTQVDFTEPKQAELLSSGEYTLLADLQTLTEGVDIAITADEAGRPLFIKVVGGYGIYKEAARLSLEEVLSKGPNAWAKVAPVYERHRRALEVQALKLGRQAIKELRVKAMNDEILKMIGALNWRTSYRQNQYFHSLEVAKLAGILAQELRIDPELAKRSGILHDIGKTIDYRIEGSHAVISGDYADRFGESRLVCDTVMSHHNDLVVESPLAYVLKTADTLSGARPGARVNLEEGYQIRLSAIEQVVKSFPGIMKVEIMNGGREVHIDVNFKKVKDNRLAELSSAIARKIEEDVAFPGQIKVIVSRRFEVVAVA